MIARRVLSKYRSMQLNSALAPVAIEHSAIKIEVAYPSKGLLSKREQEVLELVSRVFSYDEIAILKNLSMHTIQTHVKSL